MYQNIKLFLRKNCALSWSEEVLLTKEVKNTVSWIYVIEDLHDREIIGTFYENQLQLRIGVELLINKKRVIDYILRGNIMIICLTTRLIKKYHFIK